MRVAVFGGSFNPPHVGHAMVASWARWTDAADAVWLVPTFAHPFGKELAPFDVRVAMCDALAAELGPWVRVETVEATLPSPSFTLATLRALAEHWPQHRFRLLVGGDMLGDTVKWRGWDEIERDFAPIVVGRGAMARDGLGVPDISSTDIRARLRDGRGATALVSAGVRPLAERVWGPP